jgi:hypothetical protein
MALPLLQLFWRVDQQLGSARQRYVQERPKAGGSTPRCVPPTGGFSLSFVR